MPVFNMQGRIIANGATAEVEDKHLGRIARTDYDLADRPCQTELKETATGKVLYRALLKYDKFSNLEQFTEKVGSESHTTNSTYDRDNRVTAIQYDGGAQKVSYVYNALGRVAARTAECGADAGKLTSTYAYVDGAYGTNSTTPLVKKITQNGISFEYTYDSRGNIVSEKRGNLTTTYAYDALGQLIRVNDPHENATWVYNYDRGGNITSKVRYAYTTGTVGTAVETIPYAYSDSNWKDKLTSYNGTAITYDAIGNPLNDGSWTYEWSVGRQLKKMSRDGQSLTFKYDHNGMRMQKIVEAGSHSETANYYLCGKLLTHMSVDCRDASEAAHQDVMHFFYDAQSRPAKVRFNGTIYTYLHNFQGDIVGLIDNSGALVVEYKYGAWGNPLATTGSLAATLGKRNPFRYRGYIYDEETGLYYLRNRYYSPAIGRFLIADLDLGDQKELLHHNGFTYCRNAPILFVDMDGFGCFLAGIAIIGAVIGVATQLVSNLINGEDWKNNLVGAAVGGAVFNVVATTTGSIAAASYASAAAESATNEAVSYLTGKKDFTADNLKDSALNIAVDTALNGSVYVITGRIANRLHPINDKWFKPQKSLKIVLTGKYGIHVWKQTGWQGFYNAVWNGYRGFWEPAFRMDQ